MKLAEICRTACAVLSDAESCAVGPSLQEQVRLVHQSWINLCLEYRAQVTNLDASRAQQTLLKQLKSESSLARSVGQGTVSSAQAKAALWGAMCAGRTLQARVGNALRSHDRTRVWQLLRDCINTWESLGTDTPERTSAKLVKVVEFVRLEERFERTPVPGARNAPTELRNKVNAFITATQKLAITRSNPTVVDDMASSSVAEAHSGEFDALDEVASRVVAAFERELSAKPKLYKLCELACTSLSELHHHFQANYASNPRFTEVLTQLDLSRALWDALNLTVRARGTYLDAEAHIESSSIKLTGAALIAIDPSRDINSPGHEIRTVLREVYNALMFANSLATNVGNALRSHGQVTLASLRKDLSVHCRYFNPPTRPKIKKDLNRFHKKLREVRRACEKSDRHALGPPLIASRELVDEFNKCVTELTYTANFLSDPNRHSSIYFNGHPTLEGTFNQLTRLFDRMKDAQNAVQSSSLAHVLSPTARSQKVAVLV